MGGSFSSVTQEWELAGDQELRQRFINAVRSLFPSYRSFAELDDELSFSLLDVEGSGLISEIALHNLVKRCGFKMERWQLQCLLKRLDSDGDGMIGFADFILFMHGQDPKVAQKRGIRGPRAINVALVNKHLQGDYTKKLPSNDDFHVEVSSSSSPPSSSTINAMKSNNERNILLFDNRKMLTPQGRRDSSILRDTSHGKNAKLSFHDKNYLRKKRGDFVNFDQFRSSRQGDRRASPNGATGGSLSASAKETRPSTVGSVTSKATKTLRGVPVSGSGFDYYGDQVSLQASRSITAKHESECASMFDYMGEVFHRQDQDRTQRIRKNARERARMNTIGRDVIGKAVIWRTDAGEPGGDIASLVRAGPCYWDPSREHLHVHAFSDNPPPLGRPLYTEHEMRSRQNNQNSYTETLNWGTTSDLGSTPARSQLFKEPEFEDAGGSKVNLKF